MFSLPVTTMRTTVPCPPVLQMRLMPRHILVASTVIDGVQGGRLDMGVLQTSA